MDKSQGLSQVVQTTPYDADVMAQEAEASTSVGVAVCYRCHRDIEKFHSSEFYCREFSSYASGRWLLWDNIRKVLTTYFNHHHRALNWWHTSSFEDPVDMAGTFHQVIGIAVDGQFLGRFESPHQPEFSIIYHDPALDKVPSYRHVHEPDFEYVYMGWRGQLRSMCTKVRERLGLTIDFTRLARDLGVSGDRTGEEVTRFQVGWV